MENNSEKVVKVKKVKGQLPPFAQKLPEHLTNLVRIIKNNAEIRHYTALGILNWLMQKGVIKGEKRYVEFKWNKFIITTDGWSREFSYREPFFINCLVASFSCFVNNAQKTINTYVNKEIKVTDEISSENAELITKSIIENSDYSNEVVKENDTTKEETESSVETTETFERE